MDLHAVETRLPGQVHGMAEIFDKAVDLTDFQASGESGRIEVEPARSADRHASAGGTVRHVAAMPELDGAFSALPVHRIGNPPEAGNNLLAHPKLSVKGQAAAVH